MSKIIKRLNDSLDEYIARNGTNKSLIWDGRSIRKERVYFKYYFCFEVRQSKGWGRFGGGWQYKLGFQIGGTTVILNLLVATLSIRKAKPDEIEIFGGRYAKKS